MKGISAMKITLEADDNDVMTREKFCDSFAERIGATFVSMLPDGRAELCDEEGAFGTFSPEECMVEWRSARGAEYFHYSDLYLTVNGVLFGKDADGNDVVWID